MPSSPISSRKSEPPCAASKRPARVATAPVKAPFSWPNSSLSMSVEGIAAQLTRMNGAAVAGAALMQRAGQQFLARTGFAQQEDRHVGRGRVRQPREHVVDRGALADDLLEVVRRLHFLPQRDVLFLEAIAERANLLEADEQFGVAALSVEGTGQDVADDPEAVDVEGGPLARAASKSAVEIAHWIRPPTANGSVRMARIPRRAAYCALGAGLWGQVAGQIAEDDVAAALELLEEPGKVLPDRRGGRGSTSGFFAQAWVVSSVAWSVENSRNEARSVPKPLHDRPEAACDFFVEAGGLDSRRTGPTGRRSRSRMRFLQRAYETIANNMSR